jgi:multiple sugar transport system ATP-binding protein
MASVELVDVDKIFSGDVRVVAGFTLSVADGEFVVLVGPSGCGKSTTLRMIAGLEQITSGVIKIDGRVVNDMPPRDRDIAMVFQNYALYPHMTVFENMAFGLKLRKVPKQALREKVEQTAKILDIAPLLERKPKALSGGQRQRVAVGRAMVRDPKCFLFDEPLSNLDAKLRVEMRAEIKRLQLELKSTTIYVTHDQEEAMTLGDRIVVMKDGVIQQCGTPLQTYHHPTNRFVAGFLGSPPMNFFDGQLVEREEGLWFDEGSGSLPVPSWATESLRPRVGTELVLGIRPEALSHDPAARFAADGHHLQMTVGLVQPLGDKMDLHLSTERHPAVVAHVDAQAGLVKGQQLRVYFDLARAHFFEPGERGATLASGAGLARGGQRATAP